MEMSWRRFFQENFDKLLLIGAFIYCCQLVMHLTHDAKDAELVLWGREMSGTVLGALLGLITGHALASRQTIGQVINPAPGQAEMGAPLQPGGRPSLVGQGVSSATSTILASPLTA